MELESILLIEITQTQKNSYHMDSLIGGFKHKAKKTNPQITIPENLENNKDPKREMYIELIYIGGRKKT